MSLHSILAKLACSHGSYYVPPPAPTPTPTPTPSGYVATPNMPNEQPISAASFADLLATNGGNDGDVYRVLTGGVPTVINPGNFSYSKSITAYPDYRGAYLADPYGSGKPHKGRFQRMLSILGFGLWNRVSGPIDLRYIQLAMPDIWPNVAAGETWESLVPTDGNLQGNRLRAILNSSGAYPLKLYSCEINGHYRTRGTPIPFGVALPEGDGPTSGFYGANIGTHPELRGIYSDTSDSTFTVPFSSLDVTGGDGKTFAQARNKLGAGAYAGKIYNSVAQMPSAMKAMASSGYFGELYTEYLHVHDIGSSLACAVVTQGKSVEMWWPIFERVNALQFEAPLESPAVGVHRYMKAPLFDQPLFSTKMIGLGHDDLFHITSGVGDGIWTDIEEDHFFLNWRGSELSQPIDGHLQPIPGGYTNKLYADGPKRRRCLTPGVGGDGLTFIQTSRAYFVGNKAFTPAYDARTLSDNASTNIARPTSFTAPGAFDRIESNVTELFGIEGGAVSKSNNLMSRHSTADQTALFGSGITSAPATAEALYQKMTAGDPLYSAFPTLIDFLEGVTDMSAMPLDVSFYPIVGATAGASVTGEPLLIHGGNNGDTFSGTCSAGLTVEIVSPDAHSAFSTVPAVTGTQIAAASSTPTLISGKKAVAHVTASSSSGGVVDYTLTAGGQTFVQRVITASSNIYPIASVSSFKIAKAAAALGTTSSTKLSLAAIFKPSSVSDGNQRTLLCVSNGNAAVSIRLNGDIVTIQGYDSGSNLIFDAAYYNSDRNLVTAASDTTLLVSIDRTKANILDGLKVYINNKAVMPQLGFKWAAGTMDLSGKVELLGDSYFGGGTGFPFIGTVSLIAVTSENIGATILDSFRINPSIPEAASGTTAGANTGGKLMSPTARQWEVWFAGKATRLNAGTNDGSMTGFTVTGTATQTTDATWPL